MRYRMSSSDPDRPDEYGVKGGEIARYGLIAAGLVIVALGGFVWFVCRIEVPDKMFVPLLKKTGENMTNDMVLAPDTATKGPQFTILKEGRHFRFPYTWGWPDPIKATDVPKYHVGIQIRRYGKPLAPGQIIARSEDERGILAEPLKPGRYYINPRAYDVEPHEMVNIEAGHMGVVTLLVGPEPQDPNVFVVKDGERGTQPKLLTPGKHEAHSNPYVHKVIAINVRSQKFEMAAEYAIIFPSKSGFDIRVEGTIEWAPDTKKLPDLFVKYVDTEDLQESGKFNNIQRKIILPFARSFFRTIGGQYRAVDYITGDTRIIVQKAVEKGLKESCAEQGILIKSVVIRSTEPPQQIRAQYQRRELAQREIDQYNQEIITEIGSVVKDGDEAKLGPDGKEIRQGGRLAKIIEEHRKDRQTKFGQIRVEIAEAVRQAEQYQKVEVTKAQKELEVARIRLEAAKDRAARITAEGFAKAEVTVMKHRAEAQAVQAKISAFGTGGKYAEYQLITRLSPGIKQVLSNTEGLFAKLFERFTTAKSDKRPGNEPKSAKPAGAGRKGQ